MGLGEQTVRFSTGVSDANRGALMKFLEDMDAHVSALQAAGRDRLTEPADSGAPAMEEIQVNVSVGRRPSPGPVYEAEEGRSVWCGTVSVPCGKSADGYIYCSVTYCEITGPITVSR